MTLEVGGDYSKRGRRANNDCRRALAVTHTHKHTHTQFGRARKRLSTLCVCVCGRKLDSAEEAPFAETSRPARPVSAARKVQAHREERAQFEFGQFAPPATNRPTSAAGKPLITTSGCPLAAALCLLRPECQRESFTFGESARRAHCVASFALNPAARRQVSDLDDGEPRKLAS